LLVLLPVANSVGQTAKLDCFFNFVDFSLYANLVEFAKKHKGTFEKTYEQLYNDVRKAVHASHNDGSIKKEVAKDPAKYITRDDLLIPTLQHLRNGAASPCSCSRTRTGSTRTWSCRT
jgi:hypothetical protein